MADPRTADYQPRQSNYYNELLHSVLLQLGSAAKVCLCLKSVKHLVPRQTADPCCGGWFCEDGREVHRGGVIPTVFPLLLSNYRIPSFGYLRRPFRQVQRR